MRNSTRTLLAMAFATGTVTMPAMGATGAESPVVSHVKVLSDKVPDVSSLDAWKHAFIKDGMSDQEKALAVWRSAVMFRHQDVPPNEFLCNEPNVHDPIKSFNVYGYGQCCCASAHIEALSRYLGLTARGWGIVAHSVPEVKLGGQWCMLDASLINYFQKPDGSIAGVEEISKSIGDWYTVHPQLRGNGDLLYKFGVADGWKGGPSVVATSHFYDVNGWLPAATHGWSSTMSEFGSTSKNFQYEYGSAIGYEVNIQLRAGERLTRNWFNKALHINMDGSGETPGSLKGVPGQADLRYSTKFGDLAPGRIGNGTLEYDVPLASGAFRHGMLTVENVETKSQSKSGPAAHVKDAAAPAVIVVRMPSSYVYLGGELNFTPVLGTGGAITVEFSDNNGLDWKPIYSGATSTTGEQKVDLKPLVYRRYDYRLRFTLRGAGTGLDTLKIMHDIQHSQRPLPALDSGANQIAFSEGPQEGTITINPNTNPDNRAKNVFYTDFHPQAESMTGPNLRVAAGTGQITFPITTPGEMTRLRVGTHYRARDAKDGFDVAASFDDGKTWNAVGKLEGPFAGNSKYFVYSVVPAGTKAALVRFSGTQRNTTLILDLRIDADYREPFAGAAPIKVTYVWQENGKEKRDVHVAAGGDEHYTIHCDAKPVMRSIVLEQE